MLLSLNAGGMGVLYFITILNVKIYFAQQEAILYMLLCFGANNWPMLNILYILVELNN